MGVARADADTDVAAVSCRPACRATRPTDGGISDDASPPRHRLVPSSADKPGLKAAGTSILRAQQAVSEDASTRWKGTIARAKARPKQDRLAVLDDNEAALSWLELRASSGAFALSVS